MDAARPNGKRFCDEMLKPQKRPKLSLPLLIVARQYKEKVAAAEKYRIKLVAEALGRSPDRAHALTMLNCLAREFGMEPFDRHEIDQVATAD